MESAVLVEHQCSLWLVRRTAGGWCSRGALWGHNSLCARRVGAVRQLWLKTQVQLVRVVRSHKCLSLMLMFTSCASVNVVVVFVVRIVPEGSQVAR